MPREVLLSRCYWAVDIGFDASLDAPETVFSQERNLNLEGSGMEELVQRTYSLYLTSRWLDDSMPQYHERVPCVLM